MLPQRALQENLDSVEILSDDEDLHGISYDIDYSSQKKEKDARPKFPFTSAHRGCINPEKEDQQQACAWPSILEEANELAGLQEKTYNSFNTSILPEERRFHKGRKGSSRFKFSFRSLSNKQDFPWACSSSKDGTCNSFEEDIEVPEEQDCFEHLAEEDIEAPEVQDCFEHLAEEDMVPRILGNILEENDELDNKLRFHKQLVGTASVSELLEDMHKTNPSWRKNLAEDNIKGKERQKSSSKRTLLYLGDRVLDDEDAPEFSCEISSEDEDIDHGYQKAQIVKGQTMADMFQEVFNTSTEDAAEISRRNMFGYHGRLQKVMQLEKERHMAYLKQLQTGQTLSNESKYIEVKILSRTLEAKLTVCQCLFGECYKSLGYEKINQKKSEKIFLEGFGNGKTMKKTIIFSPTVCGHVELEVGNIVCIHSPWKEVQVNGEETIILCTYFSPL